MGHALDHTLMDALTRRKRMQGFEVLWLPGMDHAGIATQTLVEKRLAAEGASQGKTSAGSASSTRSGVEHESGGTIGAQMRRLGDGVDWSRDRFTMDEGLSRAVRTIFKRLYDAGLIYRAERLVNWSPVLQTTISDLEVKVRGGRGRTVSFRYGSLDDASRTSWWRPPGSRPCWATPRSPFIPMTTATATWSARPCHTRSPTRDRHRRRRPRRPRIGTGAVKVTPAHDPNDFEIGMRHNLAMPSIMDTRGRIADTGTVRRPGPLRARYAVRKALWGRGPHRRREAALPAQRRALRAQRRTHRTAAVRAVVGEGRIAGQGGRRCGSAATS